MTDTDDLLARFLADGAFHGDKVWLHDAAGRVVLYMGIGPAWTPDDIDLANALRRERAEVERLQAELAAARAYALTWRERAEEIEACVDYGAPVLDTDGTPLAASPTSTEKS